jgi:hypothetical protein
LDREKVEEYSDRADKIIDDRPQMDEADTKHHLISDFIRRLGWDDPSEVRNEYSVELPRGTGKVDYALLVKDRPVIFVEAKGLDKSLSEEHRGQLSKYMRLANVDWGLLANGEEFEILMRERDTDNPEEVLLSKFSVDGLSDNIRFLKPLSRSGVEGEEGKEIRKRRRVVKKLKNNKDGISEDIVETVLRYTGEGVPQIESEAKEFVDRIVEELRNGGGSVGGGGDDGGGDGDEDIVLTAGETVVASVNGDTQADTMANAVDFLVKERDLLDSVSMPYVPGKKKAILNKNPEHPNGEEMRGYRQISSGYYLDTHSNKEQKERRLRQLAGRCGLDVEFNW